MWRLLAPHFKPAPATVLGYRSLFWCQLLLCQDIGVSSTECCVVKTANIILRPAGKTKSPLASGVTMQRLLFYLQSISQDSRFFRLRSEGFNEFSDFVDSRIRALLNIHLRGPITHYWSALDSPEPFINHAAAWLTVHEVELNLKGDSGIFLKSLELS